MLQYLYSHCGCLCCSSLLSCQVTRRLSETHTPSVGPGTKTSETSCQSLETSRLPSRYPSTISELDTGRQYTYLCGLKTFNVAHILRLCAALDRTTIREFLEPSNNLSDTHAALTSSSTSITAPPRHRQRCSNILYLQSGHTSKHRSTAYRQL